MNKEGKAKDSGIMQEVNTNWHSGRSNRFQIQKKEKELDIDAVNSQIKEICDKEDKEITKPTTRGRKPKKQESPELVEAVNTTTFNVQEPVVEQRMEEVTAKQTSVTPQTTQKAVTSPNSGSNGLSQRESISKATLLKLVLKGMTHLYMKKTGEILTPLKFIANNFGTVFLAILNICIPSLMTWYSLNHIEIIQAQIVNETTAVTILYYGLFFVASLFVWISVQALFHGAKSNLKDIGEKLEKVGKEVK